MADEPRAPARKLLDPSELGTKEYWETAYARELSNHATDASDEGVVWFDESDAEATVLRKLASYAAASRALLDPATTAFLDLGTGNGHMLFALREDDDGDDDDDDDIGTGSSRRWADARMVGVDYSPKSVELARRVDAQRRAADAGLRAVEFVQWDLLSSGAEAVGLQPPFDVVLDKGTFDAISLMPHERAGAAPHPCEVYRDRVVPLIRPGKFLFITSCNWTRAELIEWLAPEGEQGGALELFDEAAYPTFTFGGQTGQSVVTLVFRRRER